MDAEEAAVMMRVGGVCGATVGVEADVEVDVDAVLDVEVGVDVVLGEVLASAELAWMVCAMRIAIHKFFMTSLVSPCIKL